MSGYVHQDDVIMATQTVNEALTLAATLKMNFSPQLITIDLVLQQMYFLACKV